MADHPDASQHTIATGETVSLPLQTEATVTGAVFSASRSGVRDLLPDRLSPFRVTPRRAAVTFLSVEYHDVGDGAVEPYDEFGIVLSAARSSGSVPLGGIGGYVWYLPVTNDPGRALGEVWGYPKVVGDVTIEDDDGRRRTTVDVDGERVATLDVARPRTVTGSVTTRSYTRKDGVLTSERTTFSGHLGGWPLGGRAFCELGDHPRARRLRQLDVKDRAMLRFYARGTFEIGPPRPVEE